VLLGDVIEGVATDTGQPKAVVEAIVRGVLARIEGAVGKGDTVNLVGFGRFEVYERSARRGRNLQTGETLKIPATRAVRFKIGKRPRGCRCRIEAQARWEGQEIAGATCGRMALETERIRTGRWSTFSSRPSAPEDAFL
jgi:DNA-binding protein HU-beta